MTKRKSRAEPASPNSAPKAKAKGRPKSEAKAKAKAAALPVDAAEPAAGDGEMPPLPMEIDHRVPPSPALELFLESKAVVLGHPLFQDLPGRNPSFVSMEPYKRESWQAMTENGGDSLEDGHW